jgi:Ca2+-binding EF-hand superfamily protein
MKTLTFVTLLGAGMLTLAACDQQANESMQNAAQNPELSFETADANGDGRITGQEALSAPGIDFARMDTDGNQAVTRQEFMTAMAMSRPRG